MAQYDYLIIGGGMTGAGAVRGIRETGDKGSIGMVSGDTYLPYNRPPLTKGLWKGKPEDSIWSELPKDDLTTQLNCRITQIDPQSHSVVDDAGKTHQYGKLLLATGGTPRRLPFGGDSILYYRNLSDYHTLRGWTGKGARFGVIGGGFIGSEIAAALAMNGEKAVMVFPEDNIGDRVYPRDLAGFITGYFRQKGVEVHPGFGVEGIEQRGAKFAIQGKGQQAIEVDHVIAGIGIRPNIELAQAAGIVIAAPEAGGGIQVDEHLRTSQPDVYAAGDVASFFNPSLQRRMRIEHADNAKTMGHAVGLNMAGKATPYDHQPFFYSDLFDLGYEAVGELDPRLEVFEDWREPFRQGVVYYLKDHHVRGVLLWDTWDQVDAARALIASGGSYTPADLKGRLPEK